MRRRVRQLAAAQGALALWLTLLWLAVIELTTSGNWQRVGNWTPAHKPEAKEDAKIPAGKTVEILAAAVCRSLHAEATAKVSGGLELTVGNSEKPEPAVGAGWALKIDTESANWTYTGQLRLFSTYTGEVQKVAVTPTLKAAFILKEGATAKYKLEAALTVAGTVAIGIKVQAGELQANGQTITASAVETSGTGVIDRTGLVYVTNGTGLAEGWNCRTGEALKGTANDVYEITALTGQFGGGGQEYGTVKLIGRECRVDSVNGQTVKSLQWLNKGTAEKGIQMKSAGKTIFDAIVANGTSGEPNLLEPPAAEPWKLEKRGGGNYKIEGTVGTLKGCKYEGGTLYLPGWTDGGGNTNVVFGPEPGVVAAVTDGATVSASVARIAQSPARVSGAAGVSVGAIVKSEHGPQTARVSAGAAVTATVARAAVARAAASSGATVRAEVRRVAQVAARVTAGAPTTAPVRSVRSVASRVSAGAVVSSSDRRLSQVSAAVSGGASASVVRGRVPVVARVSGGVGVYATWTAIHGGGTPEPPTSTPVAGHVAIGQRGTIGVHRGSIPTGNIGRAER